MFLTTLQNTESFSAVEFNKNMNERANQITLGPKNNGVSSLWDQNYLPYPQAICLWLRTLMLNFYLFIRIWSHKSLRLLVPITSRFQASFILTKGKTYFLISMNEISKENNTDTSHFPNNMNKANHVFLIFLQFKKFNKSNIIVLICVHSTFSKAYWTDWYHVYGV